MRLLDGGYMFSSSRGIVEFRLELGSRHRALGGSPDAFLAVDSRHFLFGEHRGEQRLTKLSNATESLRGSSRMSKQLRVKQHSISGL
jgi:hypothetical protein